MGVYIKGMDKPKRCSICPLCRYYYENGNVWCNALNVILESIPYERRLLDSVLDSIEPHKDCPLIEMDIFERHRDCNGRFSATPSDGEWLEIESLDGEKWKPIKGFEGKYAVSNMGRIRNAVRVLSQRQYSRYLKVTLSDGKERKTRMVHRLVAEAFVPNPHNYPQVNHKDENKHNNRADNLEWCTAKYNLYYGKTPPIKNLVHMEDAVIEAEGE